MEEDDEHLHVEDLSTDAAGDDLSLLDIDGQDAGPDDDDNRGDENLKVESIRSFDVKIRELLRNICSLEVAIYSKASKEFVRLLGGDSGGEMLCEYVRVSPSCMELLEAWKLRQGKPGMVHVLSLISAILNHPDGKYLVDDLERLSVSRRIDKLARTIVETKMEDVYTELNSGEAKRQSAALLLIAAVVRRGVGLASEVAKVFDFKLPVFPKLAEVQLKKGGKRLKHSTRLAFIQFAMSFVEVGNPRLLRWILQKKDMYYGVLRRLSDDDEESIIYILTKLRDKVLNRELLVPVGLKSVLFGSVTLEQLSSISGNLNGGPAADMAHEILVMVCTDPCNGLMPDMKPGANSLKGNPKRLLGLMKKLKATEIGHHRALLLAIVHGRPLLGSACMDEFPYVLEPRASHLWFAAITLAADLIASSLSGLSLASFSSQLCDPPTLDCLEIQCILKCIIPRSVTRLVINRGLLHTDILVKHGSLRLLSEALKALDRLIGAINISLEHIPEKELMVGIHPGQSKMKGLLGNSDLGNVNLDSTSCEIGQTCPCSSPVQKWLSVKLEIQNEVRTMLPDPQVLLKLLSSLNHGFSEPLELSLKRGRESEHFPEVKSVKKMKSNSSDENIDIIIGGLSTDYGSEKAMGCCNNAKDNLATDEEAGDQKDDATLVAEIWGLHESSAIAVEFKGAETYFHSKLLDVLTLYLRNLPFGMDGSFDFLKILPSNPLILPVGVQESMLSLLIEYAGRSHGSHVSSRCPEQLFKRLPPLINLLIFSPLKGIKDKAFILAHAAMLSTGAFDRNLVEIDSWFLFLPGYDRNNCSIGGQVNEVFQDLSAAVISFFCDAVSIVGNNLYKYLDHVRLLVSKLEAAKDLSLNFSPLVTCILQKCLRLLESDAGMFRLQDKTMISMYVCSTLSFILQTQVEVGPLPFLLDSILKEKLEDAIFLKDESMISRCEWRPLKNLHLFVQSILSQKACCRIHSINEVTTRGDNHSISEILADVKKITKSGHIDGVNKVATAFCSAVVCAEPDDLLESFPLLICVTCQLLGENITFLTSLFFCERNLLPNVTNLWPDMFFSGLELVGSTIFSSYEVDDGYPLGTDFDSIDSASVAFSLFLERIPFHLLFSALTAFRHSDFLGSTKILDLLRAKLSSCSVDGCISLLRLVLFWIHQISSSYRAKPSAEMEQLLESFFILIEHMMENLFILSSDSGSSKTDAQSSTIRLMQELAESVLCHPVVAALLSHPFACDRNLKDQNFGDSLEAFLSLAKLSIHPTDDRLLQLLKHVVDYILSVINASKSTVYDALYQPSLNAFKLLVQRAVLIFKEKIDQYIIAGDLIPLLQSFYVFHAFMCFLSPFELMELVYWIFNKVDQNDSVGCKSSGLSVISIGIFIAEGAFCMLAGCLRQQDKMTISCNLLWKMEDNNFDFTLLKQVYYKIVTYAIHFRLACADLCLLQSWRSFYHTEVVKPEISVLPISMVMSRLVISSPIEVLVHFIRNTNITKVKALLRLTEASSLHLNLFGQLFLYIIDKGLPDADAVYSSNTVPPVCDVLLENCGCPLSDGDFLLLLPVALSLLTSISVRFAKPEVIIHFRRIPSFYSRILFDFFSHWRISSLGNIFQEEYFDLMPKSVEEFLSICTNSFLGKALQMLQCYFCSSENFISNKKRVKLFNSIYPHGELLGCDLSEIDVHSSKQSLNFINVVVAKISLSRMLLFPHDKLFKFSSVSVDTIKEMPMEVRSDDRLKLARPRFMNIIVSALDKIVKTFPLSVSDSINMNGSDYSQLFRYLEFFILENILQISMNMCGELIQMHEIPFLKPFIQSSLLHRFEDPTTLRALHRILLSLTGGRFSSGVVFELLLAHSQFVPTILWNESTSDLSSLSQGSLSRPISSILKGLALPSTNKTTVYTNGFKETLSEKSSLCERKLEVIKLLRVLYHLKSKQVITYPGKEASMNSRELLSLLLSGYGATLNGIDLEIFCLMHEIESIEGPDSGSIAEMDYLWGSSALKLRREQALERFLSSSNAADCESAEEWRRRLYRENIPVDPKICVKTVLHFCYDRVAWPGLEPLEKPQQFTFVDSPKLPPPSMGDVQRYDPAFLLRFSMHGLSMGYIESLEFAGLGLLAVAFVSLSSPDEGLRKIGYEVLSRFKKSLEGNQSSKDVLRLRLLLTYLQNGIAEPWQKIPSPTAIFVAEASFILLDPAHDHYLTINNFLIRCSQVDLKAIPLFHTFFGSSSVHFKMDHLWILSLLYASLKLDDDAQIFMKKHIIEQLLSFYVSSLSDHKSKVLILQIVKKSVEFHRLGRYLVENCGLISWLSSILPLSRKELFGEQMDLYLTQTSIIVKVVHVIISSKNLVEWLQKHGLEQLSEHASHLHMLFIVGPESLKKNIELLNSILGILVSTLRISQKRKLYQPHFTLAFDGLYGIFEALANLRVMEFCLTAELGLKTMLMSMPPISMFLIDTEKLSKFLMWAVATALQSTRNKECGPCSTISGEDSEEDLISKLLRWLTASLILWKISSKCRKTCVSLQIKTLQSLIETINVECEDTISNVEVVAATLLYLQQLIRANSEVLSSLVAALSLLFCSNAKKSTVLLNGFGHIASLCSKIRSPVEANPAWRWSYYQPWRDLSWEQTDEQRIDEQHACQTLLLMFSNALNGKSFGFPVLSHQDLESSNLFCGKEMLLSQINDIEGKAYC